MVTYANGLFWPDMVGSLASINRKRLREQLQHLSLLKIVKHRETSRFPHVIAVPLRGMVTILSALAALLSGDLQHQALTRHSLQSPGEFSTQRGCGYGQHSGVGLSHTTATAGSSHFWQTFPRSRGGVFDACACRTRFCSICFNVFGSDTDAPMEIGHRQSIGEPRFKDVQVVKVRGQLKTVLARVDSGFCIL